MPTKSLHLPRPSAAMLVAVTALFISLGGASYAAFSVPANSVGTAQLQHSSVVHSKLRFNSVSFQDIQPQAIGLRRADLNQLQQRVASTCGSGQAIGAIQNNGKVNCNAARPAEFGTTTPSAVPVPVGGATVDSLTLPTGSSYMAFANPQVSGVPGKNETCSLTVGANKQTRTASVPAGGSVNIPLQVAGPSGTAIVSCAGAGAASVTGAINALETSTNN
ncbi:MAG: hypothetical protein ABI323_09495 [Solirubrobacteraceae bacterium]